MQSSNLDEHLYGSNNNGKSNIDNLNDILDNLETSDNENNDNESTTPSSLHNNCYSEESIYNFDYDYEDRKINEQFLKESIERIELLFRNKDGENITDVLTNIYNILKEKKN